MITPQFSCTQTDGSIIVSLYCPSVRASELDMHVERRQLAVHVNPYFLRLHFPADLLTEEDAPLDRVSTSSASYDPSSGHMTIELTKATKGEDFRDLDLLAKLLAPPPRTPAQPTIEVIDSVAAEDDEVERGASGADAIELVRLTSRLSLENREILEAAQNDWRLTQQIPIPEPLHTTIEKRYGFLSLYSGYFRHVAYSENEVNELGADAETCLPDERRRRRVAREDSKFDEEHYMADFIDDEHIQQMLTWTHPYLQPRRGVDFKYTDAENATMLRLPRKEYLATATQTHSLYLTLATLLFAYAYDARTTQHEPTPESAWTICVLTPPFAALDPPPYTESPETSPPESTFTSRSVSTTLLPSFRRALAFPLYRSYALATACRLDVANVLRRGKRTITRCLLELKNILDKHEAYYVYSKIWVDDYCVWVPAYAEEAELLQLADAVEEAEIDKDVGGWDLEALECAALVEQSGDSDDESN